MLFGIGVVLGVAASIGWPDATVLIESQPAGAEVTFEGQAVGQTPYRLSSRPFPVRGRVELELEGYRPWRSAVQAGPGQTSLVRIVLQPIETVESIAVAESVPTPTATPAPSATPTVRPRPSPAVASPTPVATKRADPAAPVAIIVENSVDARPQTGLAEADLVYEALAEGGITRFMAVYVNGSPRVVGPVRSARHYFVSLAAELEAPLVHVGSSPQGYSLLRQLGLPDLDETYGHDGFWRSSARLAPHNAYTSVAAARAALAARGAPTQGSWGGLLFDDGPRAAAGPAAPIADLEYRPWRYRVQYRYEPERGTYARFMDGLAHLDAESGDQIRAGTVVVLSVKSWVVDQDGRLDMALVGEGPATYFLDGVAVDGTWRKATAGGVTHFLDQAGQPVSFHRGPVWFQLIPPESMVKY